MGRFSLLLALASFPSSILADSVPAWCSSTTQYEVQDTFVGVNGICGSDGATTNGNCFSSTDEGVCYYVDACNDDCCVVFAPNGVTTRINDSGCLDPCIPKTPMPTPAPVPTAPTTIAPTIVFPTGAFALCAKEGVTDSASCNSKCNAAGRGSGRVESLLNCINNDCTNSKNCYCGSTTYCIGVGVGTSNTSAGTKPSWDFFLGLLILAYSGQALAVLLQ